MTASWRVSVDPIACTGHGVCADMLPEIVDLDDWGYPRIDPAAVPRELLRSARRAVSACPALALSLRAAGPPDSKESPNRDVDRRSRNIASAEGWS